MTEEEIKSGCEDCGRSYGDPGFPDLIIPFWAWREISTSKSDGGLLCPSCICARLEKAKIKCPGAFMSGPIESVTPSTMHNMRSIENIALAIEEGRLNMTGEALRKLIRTEMESRP
jgi:hypothetical protein